MKRAIEIIEERIAGLEKMKDKHEKRLGNRMTKQDALAWISQLNIQISEQKNTLYVLKQADQQLDQRKIDRDEMSKMSPAAILTQDLYKSCEKYMNKKGWSVSSLEAISTAMILTSKIIGNEVSEKREN